MVPEGVKVTVEGDTVRVEGPRGVLEQRIAHAAIRVTLEGNVIRVHRQGDRHRIRALHGLYRSLIANMVEGVSRGFQKVLEIEGVGYRAELQEQELVLSLGYSHPVRFPLPPGVQARVEGRGNRIVLEGADKQLVGQVAASIRALRPPDPYKGKGIRYAGEVLRLKPGKGGAR